jgi:AcrR family transcriptional regulator
MHIQDSQRTSATASGGHNGAGRAAPLRVDAQRNLEHVLRAAREVFGELGYGAPMEDVARRARVGVGTVYRRFPSKDVLVRRIAEEETARLTEQARTALGQEDEAWSALARFLRTSASSGAGRLLPPQVLRVDGTPVIGGFGPAGADDDEAARVPHQRSPFALAGAGSGSGSPAAAGHVGHLASVVQNGQNGQNGQNRENGQVAHVGRVGHSEEHSGRDLVADPAGDDGIGILLDVVGQLVERAKVAGELRVDVSVADVLLVIATAAPALPDADQQAAASARLLDILLEGLRSRPGELLTERIGDHLGERLQLPAAERAGDHPGERAPDLDHLGGSASNE